MKRIGQTAIGFILGALCVLALLTGLAHAQGSPNGIRGAFTGDVYVPGGFKLRFGDNVAGDTAIYKGAAYTTTFQGHLGVAAANDDKVGTCAIGSTCVITFSQAYASAPSCTATDQTAAAAVKSAPTTTGVTFTGTGTDTVAYHCIGNPN